MKKIIINVILLLIFTLSIQSQIVGDTCITKQNLYNYAKEIYELKRTNYILEEMLYNKDSLIILKNQQIQLYTSNIREQEIMISNYIKSDSIRTDIIKLQEIRIQELQPKWYERKEVWFGAGLVLGILIVL